ncbi:ATP-binding protein [Halorussus limi]|uniref:ATP-binding protein n=1 Tax=Halorussus limi TaxID=2938695 RepID=A0A8U0HPF4_9EURY|nr:ATP-binding protein [Halorussus limi]UPV72729.1 ATP-binding protein [Halorussus limi]
MNSRDRTLDELVEQFMANPGSAESEQLDFKAKEIVESTEGKRDLAKKASAIANTNGGTIVVGVGEGSREDIIQSFDARSEIKRDLASVFRDNTKPPLDRLTEINIETLSMGARLLRIDIQPSNTYPIEFYNRDSDEYVPYHRVEDTTREMATSDIVEFTKRHSQPGASGEVDLEESITVRTSDIQLFNDSDPRKSPDHRAILNIDQHGLVVPAKAYIDNSFHKSLTFHVEKRAEKRGLSGLKGLLREAEEELNADLGFDFGYAIKYGTKELIGRNSDNYIQDIQNLEKTLELLGWEDNSDPRPIAIAGTRCDFGFIWFQAQYHTGSLSRIKCGLMMSDIPINNSPLSSVFGNEWYEQHNSLRSVQLRLRGDEVSLSNPREVLLDESSGAGRTEIIADNPYFQNKEAILESIDNDALEPFINAICAVDRLPFDVRGGYSSKDIYHSVGEIQMSYIHAVVPAYFVWPMSDPHVVPPSEDPPTPDWLDSLGSDDADERSDE